ncbi:MAG: dienelactone hydrolase family protein [Zymomonas mobilis]|uniref:Carboxymethylenebutenolidase n=1 Tax=Zymomonas mobilis TaxID=542 RepID=A0A542VZ13_ZYMMB|nr:dienelactone hydrolase family protein [Zymomonas mobilis]TQL16566.1 carboxymethylenebutenolidase [Zymomonas mobilis]
MGQKITIPSVDKNRRISAYQAAPEHKPKAVIVVIPEIFGINEGIRLRVDRWAKAGYWAIAADIFWNIAPDVELDPDIPEQMQQAMAYYQKLENKEALMTIEAAIAYARSQQPDSKIATVGYYLGGFLSFLLAAEEKVEAAVCYYGVDIDQNLSAMKANHPPIMLHFGDQDNFVSEAAIKVIHSAFQNQPDALFYLYSDAGHGFATEKGKRRAEKAARLADQRSFDFIERVLS